MYVHRYRHSIGYVNAWNEINLCFNLSLNLILNLCLTDPTPRLRTPSPISESAALHAVKLLKYDRSDVLKSLRGQADHMDTNELTPHIEEIKRDMVSDKTMNRLIQGDVGSGKTILAVLALLNCALAGKQSAMMVPTEVLAKQQYEISYRYTKL